MVSGMGSILNMRDQKREKTADNIPLRSVRSPAELWEKLMKEVNLKRFAGPFKEKEIPFKYFAQSPIGLVPKAGNKTRLIFHLSYDFPVSKQKSINAHTDKEHCRVKYRDLDEAVRIGLQLLENQKRGSAKKIFSLKTDLSAAFRMIPLARNCWKWLLMKARNPGSGSEEWSFFLRQMFAFWTQYKLCDFSMFLECIETLVGVCHQHQGLCCKLFR